MAGTVVHGSVNVRADGGEAWCYLARPAAQGRHPGMLVIQEWWGLEPHMFDVAQRFAREGFVALAPDLFQGRVTNDAAEARSFTQGLDRRGATATLVAAVDALKAMPECNGKVGVIGYCMGGGLALQTAIHSDRVDAVNPYYGANPDPIDLVERIRCPVLGLYAEHDEANRPSVPALQAALRRHGRQFECIVYPDAPHAFFNDTQPSYRAEAARDAWRRTLAFMRQHLG